MIVLRFWQRYGFAFFLCTGLLTQAQNDLVQYVNPLMGTDSEFSLSNGNTYPAVALPWGMNFWSPQTAKMGDGWMYAYDAYHIRGFKQTHQPSPWINDYAAFSIMPVTGALKFKEDDRKSWFSHKTEISLPHYYSVYLADYNTKVEFTPSERAAHFQITFPRTDSAYIVLDAFDMGSMVEVIAEDKKIIGYCRNNHGGVPDNFHNYFVLEFDKEFEIIRTFSDSILTDKIKNEGNHVGAVIGFKTNKDEKVQVKVASSFISPDQAQLNLERELEASFEKSKLQAENEWNHHLGRIRVKSANPDNLRTFYSCLYRLLLFPRKFYEISAEGDTMHYSPYNGEVLPGVMFTDNGFWDTFRAVFPFFTLMYPSLNAEIMQGLVNTYKESGWLPEWASPGHRDCMIGSNSASIIADSYLKGIRGYDIATLYEAILKNTRGAGPVSSVGRLGAEYYNELGYVPYDVNVRENAARSLEYAYADFTIYRLAEALNRPKEEIDLFRQRSENYRMLFDPESNLMRGKNKNGEFEDNFNPFKWGDAFTEGNSWHYSWSVFHDIQGLIDLMGGKEAFCQKLDSVFLLPPKYDESYYGFVIHEIREMQIMGMGQYAHGNQPIQHMAYLYNYAGQPWKSQKYIRQILSRLYHSGPDGYCGDEDNGQTSAWYVFSALGFYPVCPGTNEYVIGSPLFDEAEIKFENGASLKITANDNGPGAPFIDDVILNGSPYQQTYFTHQDLQAGGQIEISMSDQPNFKRGIGTTSTPYSMSK
ncbi:MAG: GH92 family glycosyl hydrolase [Saprospiraceae bacterium]|nr:GH92 family glycosyl hydrolase [Saprospiraceae bacterium]